MTPNITDEQRKQIEYSSTEYANKEIGVFKYLGATAAREQWHQTYKDFEAGYTAACHQKDQEIARLRAEIKEHVDNINSMGQMVSDTMGRVVQLKKQLGQPHVHTNDLLDFFMGELWAYTTNLEGIHIGSNNFDKDQVMRFVFDQTKEIMAFLNYAGWCNSSFREGQTWEQFVDWQLDELNKENTDLQRKEFIKKFIAKFNVVINP